MPQTDTKERDGILVVHPLKANTKVCAGEIGCLDASGYLVPASAATDLKAVGRIEETVTGGTTDGEEKALVKKGVFLLKNNSSDKVTRAHIESDCCRARPKSPRRTVKAKVLRQRVPKRERSLTLKAILSPSNLIKTGEI